ncbi:hypothetical protein BDQ17DRAFT_1333140 [Cyathus striatus]|nr:hypothetical protein BDQ17DRAFT_1333140 [Cyathus striatus]
MLLLKTWFFGCSVAWTLFLLLFLACFTLVNAGEDFWSFLGKGMASRVHTRIRNRLLCESILATLLSDFNVDCFWLKEKAGYDSCHIWVPMTYHFMRLWYSNSKVVFLYALEMSTLEVYECAGMIWAGHELPSSVVSTQKHDQCAHVHHSLSDWVRDVVTTTHTQDLKVSWLAGLLVFGIIVMACASSTLLYLLSDSEAKYSVGDKHGAVDYVMGCPKKSQKAKQEAAAQARQGRAHQNQVHQIQGCQHQHASSNNAESSDIFCTSDAEELFQPMEVKLTIVGAREIESDENNCTSWTGGVNHVLSESEDKMEEWIEDEYDEMEGLDADLEELAPDEVLENLQCECQFQADMEVLSRPTPYEKVLANKPAKFWKQAETHWYLGYNGQSD